MSFHVRAFDYNYTHPILNNIEALGKVDVFATFEGKNTKKGANFSCEQKEESLESLCEIKAFCLARPGGFALFCGQGGAGSDSPPGCHSLPARSNPPGPEQ